MDLTPIFNAAITLCAATITAFFLPWVRRKTTAQDRAELLAWVDIAVAAAQQLYHSLNGEERKKYALSYLATIGYSVNQPEVDAAIEAAVLRLHQQLEWAV